MPVFSLCVDLWIVAMLTANLLLFSQPQNSGGEGGGGAAVPPGVPEAIICHPDAPKRSSHRYQSAQIAPHHLALAGKRYQPCMGVHVARHARKCDGCEN